VAMQELRWLLDTRRLIASMSIPTTFPFWHEDDAAYGHADGNLALTRAAVRIAPPTTLRAAAPHGWLWMCYGCLYRVALASSIHRRMPKRMPEGAVVRLRISSTVSCSPAGATNYM
jgi:hypothetical protein